MVAPQVHGDLPRVSGLRARLPPEERATQREAQFGRDPGKGHRHKHDGQADSRGVEAVEGSGPAQSFARPGGAGEPQGDEDSQARRCVGGLRVQVGLVDDPGQADRGTEDGRPGRRRPGPALVQASPGNREDGDRGQSRRKAQSDQRPPAPPSNPSSLTW